MEFNEDDFLINQDELFKNKKKKKDGSRKGKSKEREIVKILSDRFDLPFSRSIGSGNRWSQARLSETAKQIYSGDIVTPDNFLWLIESKGGYEEIDLNSIFLTGNKKLDSFLKQAELDSKRCNRKPMLLWKKDRKQWLAFIYTKELKQKFKYKLIYRNWTAVALEELLKLENKFFLKQ